MGIYQWTSANFGAFGIFHRERVIEAGGYNKKTVGEDMELVIRLHKLMLNKKYLMK
jgi:cellulose synthase/poly-beta-1,6-N-acetylglucosamine synthase-like glycosyltransferase